MKATKRYRKYKNIYNKTESDLQDLVDQKQQKEEQLEELRSRKETLSKSIEVTKKIVDVLFRSRVDEFQQLVEEGLNKIFHDREYIVNIELDSRGSNKTASFKYKEQGDEDFKTMDHGCGGSVRVVVDLLCRVYLIMELDKKKFLIIDEGLSELSDEFISGAIEFLEELSNRAGFDILFISHDERIKDHIQTSYLIEEGEVSKIR